MKMIVEKGDFVLQRITLFNALIIVILSFAGCGPEPTLSPTPTATLSPPSVTLIVNPPETEDVLPGQTVPLNADASGQEISFKWSAARGDLSSFDTPAVIYTAPDSAGVDTVTLEVSGLGGTTTRSVSFNVVTPEPPTDTPTHTPAPVETDTPTPTHTPIPLETNTPTPVPTPLPLECRHPAITSYIFPQLEDVAGQRAFYGPVEESPDVYLCGGMRDIVHSDPVSVKIEYHIVPGSGKFGYFGIGTLGGYDVSQFSQICLWAYSLQPDQAFRLKIKDTIGTEDGVDVTVPDSNVWNQICVDLQKFTDLGIDLGQLDNINLGFEEANGSVIVWVDDFELIE